MFAKRGVSPSKVSLFSLLIKFWLQNFLFYYCLKVIKGPTCIMFFGYEILVQLSPINLNPQGKHQFEIAGLSSNGYHYC